ncbi:uncharacterized protein LOC117132195 [Brassica rapa]|uniref:uncharacterized protein LOC117132195 n=1 Tax=Brassica campestris TaxID=3711 RepID=UPI00142D85BA|nr:uncharacterized protein LOC117132195 [Brassica rapa]
MDNGNGNVKVVIPVALKGVNYLLWSRLVKTALGGRDLWAHVAEGKPSKQTSIGEDGREVVAADNGKQNQEDLMVFSIIQGSLETPILEAYSYCETSKELWKTLQKVYGNIFNLSRIFEVKKAISTLHQEDSDFTQHFGKFRALWAELEMLMPTTVEASDLNDRREQDKVFALFLTLHPSYNDLIKHILRAEKLPTFEEVCAQIQKEQGSVSLFGGKSELDLGNQAEGTANRGSYKAEHKKIWICDHCKKKGHGRDKYWILHPHLKPQKFRTPQPDARSHFSG